MSFRVQQRMETRNRRVRTEIHQDEMGKKKKKNQKKNETSRGPQPDDTAETIRQLREENEMLRARLEKIAELAASLPGSPLLHDIDEEDEEDELTRDVDDQITDDGHRGASSR